MKSFKLFHQIVIYCMAHMLRKDKYIVCIFYSMKILTF